MVSDQIRRVRRIKRSFVKPPPLLLHLWLPITLLHCRAQNHQSLLSISIIQPLHSHIHYIPSTINYLTFTHITLISHSSICHSFTLAHFLIYSSVHLFSCHIQLFKLKNHYSFHSYTVILHHSSSLPIKYSIPINCIGALICNFIFSNHSIQNHLILFHNFHLLFIYHNS